jgi:hypothetical protein
MRMGACDFTTVGIGKDLKDAYRNAVHEALDYYGHQEGYSGTISTTSCPESPEPIRFKKWDTLNAYIEKNVWKVEKWDCKCIELKGKMLKDYKDKHGLKRTRKKVYVFYGVAAC